MREHYEGQYWPDSFFEEDEETCSHGGGYAMLFGVDNCKACYDDCMAVEAAERLYNAQYQYAAGYHD